MTPNADSAALNLRRWRERPDQMVRELFGVVPDAWQDEALRAFPKSPRLAMKACKGPGKTAVLAWLCWNFLLTRPAPKVLATSTTADTLADTLWPEMAKWQNKSELLKAQFTWQKTQIFCNENPAEWFMAARTWSRNASAEQQANTLAGRHADYIMFVLDESGGIPDAVMVAAEAAFAGTQECHIVQAGNPTHLTGPLYRACTSSRELWTVVEITGDPDAPNRSPRIPVEYAREQIKQYGRDNPWVLINIFGQFPPSSLNVLIGPDEVSAAMRRYYREYDIGNVPKIIGVDVARMGDDSSVLCMRQGIQMFPFIRHRNLTSTEGASIVARKWADWNADGVFIDATGGFGSGWEDRFRMVGRAPVGVQFSGKAHAPDRYVNKRAEMYFDFVEWIKKGGALPDSPELVHELTQTTYSFQGDKFLLEPKESVKSKIGHSPDFSDAAVLTFAEPVTRAAAVQSVGNRHRSEYDPFAAVNAAFAMATGGGYDPFRER